MRTAGITKCKALDYLYKMTEKQPVEKGVFNKQRRLDDISNIIYFFVRGEGVDVMFSTFP